MIWVTGVPNSGKTTFGDQLIQCYRSKNLPDPINTVRLDGDVLRVVLNSTDINDESKRHDLARQYWQLARSLALQGNLVVVSVVAVFPDILESIRSSDIKTMIVELDVDDETLILRNRRRLNLTNSRTLRTLLTHAMPDDSIKISNMSEANIPHEAVRVLDLYLGKEKHTKVCSDSSSLLHYLTASTNSIKNYWDEYYSSNESNTEPSSFAKFIVPKLNEEERLFEIGCGDGRDAAFFSKFIKVFAVDVSQNAIKLARNRKDLSPQNIEFEVLENMEQLSSQVKSFAPSIVYIRFVLHAMSLSEELILWQVLSDTLNSGTKVFLEVRTVSDAKYLKGIHISSDERFEGHYRRFADPIQLVSRIKNHGFTINQIYQGASLSVVGKDNPDLLRLELERVVE